MSVQKRKQAKALQSLATKLPLTSLAGAFFVWYGASQAFTLGDEQGMLPWVYGLVGAVVGMLIFGVVQKPIQRYENRWKAKVRELAQKMESKIDEEQGGINKLLDSYELQYLGGHPGWPLTRVEFGLFDIHEKSLYFKNKSNRIKFQLARIKRVTCEPEKTIRLKKLPAVVLPKPRTYKNALVGRLMAQIAKHQRYLLVDYVDDLGEKHLVVFQPVGGNPLVAKAVKEAFDEVHKKVPKEKKGSQAPVRQQASDEQLAAAEAASRQAQGMGRGSVPPGTGALAPAAAVLPSEGELLYQVVLDHAGSTPEEQANVAQQMASIFNIPGDKALAAVQRVPFVVKRNLTQDQGQRLVSALSATGAAARAEAMTPAPSA